MSDLQTALSHPDPDLSELVEIPKDVALEETQACHLARAILRVEDSLYRQQAAMKIDMQAWQHHLAALEARSEALRALLKDWMIRKGVPKLTSPFLTATLTKPRTKLVVNDEAAAIALCKQIGAMKAWQVLEKIVKKELDPVVNAQPKLFAGVVTEETGETGLTIRGKE